MRLNQHKATQHCIPKKIFKDLVKEIVTQQNPQHPVYWYNKAYDALQTDTEEFIMDKFKQAARIASLSKNKTIKLQHFKHTNNETEKEPTITKTVHNNWTMFTFEK